MWNRNYRKIIPDNLREQIMKEFWFYVREDDPNKCWHYNGIEKDYYPRFIIDSKTVTAHRVVHELFYGLLPKGKPYVLHSCDNKSCINPNHLRCGTSRDNAIDRRFTDGRLMFSERDAKVIKFMRNLNYTYGEISEKFNCSVCKARDICLGINTPGILPDGYNPIIRREEIMKT